MRVVLNCVFWRVLLYFACANVLRKLLGVAADPFYVGVYRGFLVPSLNEIGVPRLNVCVLMIDLWS